ncbi:hypothetical protein BASA81_007130 [Batrachochytrium salamandrivorans]|nr:hypothetical protein BASA81_007130 [Batrachochytrium salamandrivorans]
MDLLYGSLPAPAFQLPDGRLQPDFLMDTVPDWLFAMVTLCIVGGVSYFNSVVFEGDLLVQQCLAIPLGVHWFLFFAHGLPQKSEKFFDLAGQLGICAMLAFAFWHRRNQELVGVVALGLILVWSSRLAWFLFSRMLERGEDWRFVRARKHPGYHFFAWTSQGLWCFCQAQAVLGLFLTSYEKEMSNNWLAILGTVVWAIGFSLETVADAQKLAFVRLHPIREQRLWIDQGLWRYSRHPNFCGETLCWLGISLVCHQAPFRQAVFAPVFSMLFLQQTTVPWLDLLADAKYHHHPSYAQYVANTSKYWLLPKRNHA